MDRDITLGIPCFNEEETISETLSHIRRIDGNFERVIVLDDGSTDDTADVVRGYSFVDLHQHEENRGRGAARNSILAETSTPLLAMIDADIRPRSDWLSVLRDGLVETGSAAVGGQVIVPVESRADRWRRHRLRVNDYDEAGHVDHLAGGNTLFRTESLRNVGGWPELQSTEDREVSVRLRESGYSIYFTPEAVVEHVGDVSTRSVLRNLWRWHFESRNEPQSRRDLPRRVFHHVGKGAVYSIEDAVAGRWWAIPISARLPLEFLRADIDYLD